MIRHQPYGIDDPYKRLPTERNPRDPQPDDMVQVSFQTDPKVAKAWLSLETHGQPQEITAQSVGGVDWIVQLGQVKTGAYSYQIHTDSSRSEVFYFEVGAWLELVRLQSIQVNQTSLELRLEDSHGQTKQLSLSFPSLGACRLQLGQAASGLVCRAETIGEQTHVYADGIEICINHQALMLQAKHPSATAWQLEASLAWRWLETQGQISKTEATFYPNLDEALYGLGERFNQANKRGQEHDIRVYEEYKEQQNRTYLPVPLVVSSNSYGLWLNASEPSLFDLKSQPCRIVLEQQPSHVSRFDLHFLVGQKPYDITRIFTALTSEIAVPPAWAFGPWMSSNDWNNQEKTENAIRTTIAKNIPATVLVLEAWSDESTFYAFNDAKYTPKTSQEPPKLSDFEFAGRWKDPKKMIEECHQHGIRVLLWQIPVYRATADDHAPNHTRIQHHADQQHMLQNHFAVKEADGSSYRCKGWWFTGGLVMDFTNPKARDWWFSKRQYLFEDLGIDGMKTDGGEHLWGRDLKMHDGRRGLEMFNAYPNEYVGAYHNFIQKQTKDNGITFSRAGFTGSQCYPAHWAGDENSTWSAYKASIQAGLSAGLSGISIWSWDIGGFSGDIPTVELYARSSAMACFCPIMQYHSEFNSAKDNRDRSPWNIAERHNDPRALEIYRFYAQLRMKMLETLHSQAISLSQAGLPLMRYPYLEYPEARDFLAQDPDAYLFTEDLLICPVVEKGASTREVKLPPGQWVDFWSGAVFIGLNSLTMPAPLERIPVFVRGDSPRLSWWLSLVA